MRGGGEWGGRASRLRRPLRDFRARLRLCCGENRRSTSQTAAQAALQKRGRQLPRLLQRQAQRSRLPTLQARRGNFWLLVLVGRGPNVRDSGRINLNKQPQVGASVTDTRKLMCCAVSNG